MNEPVDIHLTDEFTRRLVVHSAVTGEVILITMDKIELCLMKNQNCLTSKREWATPAGILATILTTLAATQFRDYILPKEVWLAVYLLGGVAALVWTGRAAFRALKSRGRGSIDDILGELRNQATTATTPTA